MTITLIPVTEDFVAEIGNIDLSRQIKVADLVSIKEAFAKYAVLIFPNQRLSADQHLAFAQHFGPLDISIAVHRKDTALRLREELTDVSNLDARNEIWLKESRRRLFQLGARLWHTDNSFKRVPARVSLLYARSIPLLGGRTEFADERAAYDALSTDMKPRLERLVVEHSIYNSRARLGFNDFSEEERAAMPPVPQALVRRIPESGRKSLYLASHAGRIFGMPEHEGRALIDDLIVHATQRQFVYSHRWRVHDLVMWDERCTMHRGTDFDDLRWKRDLQRATIRDTANSCELEDISAPSAWFHLTPGHQAAT
jgi:alpha-ketoglutarate-dependent 2,4-dichlorophenoxyacetate dioxygenase